MRTLVLWAESDATNLGIQALASGTVNLVRRAFPDSTVDLQSYGPGPSPRRLGAKTLGIALAGGAPEMSRWLATYDLVVDTGSGDSFSDIYGLRRLAEMSALRRLAVRAGVPVVLSPQTIGPFTTTTGRRVARRSLAGVRLILARDDQSARCAAEVLGVEAITATDVVFTLPLSRVTRSRQVLLNVSGLLWEDNPHVDSARYRRTVLDFAGAVRAAEWDLALLAHVVDPVGPDSDINAVHEVAEQIGADVEVLVPTDLPEARAYIASGEVLVGSRMHACLNAISLGVPSIPWAYSRKFAPLLTAVGHPNLGYDLRHDRDVAESSLVDTKEFLSAQGTGSTALPGGVEARLDAAVTALRGALCAR